MNWIQPPAKIIPYGPCGAQVCWTDNKPCNANACILKVCATRFCVWNF
jgi:hypothetical protein